MADNSKRSKYWPRFSLAAALMVLTLSSLIIAWALDRQRLLTQIPPAQQKSVRFYILSNADCQVIANDLKSVFTNATISEDSRLNYVIANATQSEHDQIDLAIRYADK